MIANNERKEIHEAFHTRTSIQKKIITRNNFTYRKIIEIIEKYVSTPKNILDIGCGAGTIDFYLANKGNTVTGIDISNKAIISCKETAKLLKTKKAKFSMMSFPNEVPKQKYDFIIISEVIEHLKYDKLAIKQIHNLLKKNGMVLITTPSKNAPLYKMGLLKKFDKEVGHLRRYTLNELKNLCSENNLNIIYYEKTEGIIRNFLFTNPIAGKLIRFIKFFLSDIVTWADNLTIKKFGESNIYILAQKP
jgi:SAM-dependent methyltransferase